MSIETDHSVSILLVKKKSCQHLQQLSFSMFNICTNHITCWKRKVRQTAVTESGFAIRRRAEMKNVQGVRKRNGLFTKETFMEKYTQH